MRIYSQAWAAFRPQLEAVRPCGGSEVLVRRLSISTYFNLIFLHPMLGPWAAPPNALLSCVVSAL